MIVFLQILFFIAAIGVLHTYLFYPLSLLLIHQLKGRKQYKKEVNLPRMAVIFAAYNEEDVIEEKILSLFSTDYPSDKLKIYIGSDASSDATDEIVEKYQQQFPELYFKRFEARTGKAGIINHLAQWADADILVGTDANIIFKEDTLNEFAGYFQEDKTHIVAGNILYQNKTKDGISKQEGAYLSVENNLKLAESDLWGKAMGVSGGLYAIRKTAFTPIPPLTFMEDFFVSFSVFDHDGDILFNPNAIGYEDTSVLQEEEFKRKTRISIGNFQNLGRFKHLLIQKPYPVGFAFLSHKILRWITPILGIITLVTSLLLMDIFIYRIAAYLQISLLLATLIDWLLYKQNVRSGPLRFIGHFYMMNLAFLYGFYKYLKGVSSNVWQPTKRNQ